MNNYRSFFLLFCSLSTTLFTVSRAAAQQPGGFGNGFIDIAHSECLSESARQEIITLLKHNIDSLQNAGVLPQIYERNAVSFAWPMQQAAGFNDPGFYAISNYIDHDASGGVQEYNCGSRTYDGHKGTDIFTWPFPWTKMDNDAVEVIAGASGTIIAKFDGNYSYNCSFTGDWNAVYVQHADGSIVWYGHLKEGTLTSKSVGQTVAVGEYLGVVGSSGWSTGPHLHMEVYDNASNLIDPWFGACNPTVNFSWWASQENYYVPTINKISTHSQLAVMPQCYGTENPHFSDVFNPNNTVYCYAFLRDQSAGQQITFTIKRPNGTTYATWTSSASTYYPASYWYYYFTLPGNAPLGTWTYSFTFNGVTLNHNFLVQNAAPVELVSFWGERSGDNNRLHWATASEVNNRRFVLERGLDGMTFNPVGEVPGAGDANDARTYEYLDVLSKPLSYYYRLLQEDNDGASSYSPVIYLYRQTRPDIEIAPNPAREKLQLRLILPDKWADVIHMQLVDINGKVVHQELYDPALSVATREWQISHLPAGIYSLQLTSQGLSETLVRKVVKIN